MKNNWTLQAATAMLLVCFSFSALAQSDISGTLTDGNAPLPFANVLLLSPTDSSLVRGTITEEDGQFLLEKIETGSYLLSSAMIGYTTDYQTIEVKSNENKSLGNITLSEEATELEGVTVTAKKPLFEQKIDRLTVNVANSITSAGATALEVLERSPGIVVNRQQNAISVAGKDGVIVMMNGKINRMPIEAVVQLLEGMPSSNIEKIEIITTPPANFDAEGNAGFINIVLKETSDRGLNGSYSLSAGYGRGDVSSAGTNFNYRKGKVNLYGDYSFSREAQEQLFTFYRRVELNGALVETDTRSERDPVQRNHNARLGLDFDLGKKTVLGILASGYDNRWSMDALNRNTISSDGMLDTLLIIDNDEINHWQHVGGNINLQHTFAPEHTLTFDADYLRYGNENPTNYLNTYSDAEGNFLYEENTFSGKETPIKVGVAKLDYVKRFSDKLKWETGIKGTLSRFDNDVRVSRFENGNEIIDPMLTADYRLEESIGAAYTSFDVQVDEKTGMKLGLRYEYTNSNLGTPEQPDIVDRQFGRFFPSFFLSRNFNDNNSANISYSRRITRPTFNEMAPFVIFLDPSTFFSGNPAIQPAISDNLKLDYRFKTVMVSIQYTVEDSAIARFQSRVIPGTNTQLIGASNMKNRKTASLSISMPIQATKWWRIQTNLIGNWQEINAYLDGEFFSIDNKNVSTVMINMFTLPKDFSAEMVGFYNSKGLFGTAQFLAIYGLNFGIQKKLPNDGGNLRFGVDDILNSIRGRGITETPTFYSRGTFDFSQRTFKLSYSRNFGNKKLKAQRRRATGAEEERRRVN